MYVPSPCVCLSKIFFQKKTIDSAKIPDIINKCLDENTLRKLAYNSFSLSLRRTQLAAQSVKQHSFGNQIDLRIRRMNMAFQFGPMALQFGPIYRYCRIYFHCTNCFELCNSYDEWFKHMEYHMTKKLECTKCNKKLSLLVDSIRHIGMHHWDKRFSCIPCGREFYTMREFNSHDCEMRPYDEYDGEGDPCVYDEDGYVVG